jgi:hypothetical protein
MMKPCLLLKLSADADLQLLLWLCNLPCDKPCSPH